MKKNKEALEKIDKDNKEAMERLKNALNKNKGIAQDMAKPILDMFNKAKGGGGFHMKGEIQFEGLQGTWERLQKATKILVPVSVPDASLAPEGKVHK